MGQHTDNGRNKAASHSGEDDNNTHGTSTGEKLQLRHDEAAARTDYGEEETGQ